MTMTEQYPREDRFAELKKDRIDDPQKYARTLVREIHYPDLANLGEVYVVWFSYTLGNWKTLVSANVKDNRYYEVTHNAAENETYVDAYTKVMHTVV
jgi:hypothetical protein